MEIEKEKLQSQVFKSGSYLQLSDNKEDVKASNESDSSKALISASSAEMVTSTMVSMNASNAPLMGSIDESHVNPFEEDVKSEGSTFENIPELKYCFIMI